MQKTSFEQNGGTYRTVGAYKIPNITLPANTNKPLGVWGLKRKDYLINHKRVQYYAYDRNAVDSSYRGWWTSIRYVLLGGRSDERKTMSLQQSKPENQMEYVAYMNNIESSAREIVNHELIFTA